MLRKGMTCMEIIIAVIAAVSVISYAVISKLTFRNKRALREAEAAMDKAPDPKRFSELDSISRYFCLAEQKDLNADALTWNDLDMDDIFFRLNTCGSSTGEEYLYALLHRRPDSTEEKTFREILKKLGSDRDLRLKVSTYLHGLGICNYNNVADKCFGSSPLKTLPFERVYSFLPFLPLIALIPAALNLFFPAIILFIAAVIFNIGIYFKTERKITEDIGTMRYLCRILYCARRIGQLCPDDKNFSELTELFKHFSSAARKISKIGSSGSADPISDALEMYFKLITFQDVRNYVFVRRLIFNKQDILRRLYDRVGMFDSACAVLNFRASTACFCEPEFVEENKISAVEMFHPLIPNAVANSLETDKSILITGSNASGKSSFVKALSINAILAQSIFTCTAESFALRRCRVITSMAVRDDICAGDSYFVAEIKSMHRIVTAAQNEYCLCAIDEILKGTNTTERIAASVSILEAMSETESICIAATHDIELTVMLEKQYRNMHFSETVENDSVYFDYTIKNGAAVTRNAIKLLEINGFSEKIIGRANNLAANLEKQKAAVPAPKI